jgi:hypothetical protein
MVMLVGISLMDFLKKIRSKQILLKSLWLSPVLPLASYLLLLLIWDQMESIWAFTPVFLIPTFWIGLPFLVRIYLRSLEAKTAKELADSLLVSILLSGIAISFFYSQILEVTRWITVRTHY